jgi:hypothetical protein
MKTNIMAKKLLLQGNLELVVAACGINNNLENSKGQTCLFSEHDNGPNGVCPTIERCIHGISKSIRQY